MRRIRKKDLVNLLLMAGIPALFFIFYAVRFYADFDHGNIIGRNVCLIIAAAFLWGMADIVRHYISIADEHAMLESFRGEFTPDKEADQYNKYRESIIMHRYNIILSLRNSISDIRHEALTEIINSRESGRAVIAKYFIGACVMLGLLGSFLGLLETVGGAYAALENISSSTQLLINLHSPLSGMSLTFTTSIVGIIASLSLGFASVFLNRRQVDFLADLEEFTQTVLIPGLGTSSGKKIDDLLEKLVRIEVNTGAFISMGQEIGEEAGKMFSAIDSCYSRLSDSLQQVMDRTMRSIEENVSGSFGSLAGSAVTSITELAGAVERSAKDMSADINVGIREFLAGEKTMIREMMDELKASGLDSRESALALHDAVSGSIRDFIAEERVIIEGMIESANSSGEKIMKASHNLIEQSSENNRKQTADFLSAGISMCRASVDSFMEKWRAAFEEHANRSLSEMQDNTAMVYKDALDRNESIITQNLDLFEKTSDEFRLLCEVLKEMHAIYQERLDQTAQAVNDAARVFSVTLEQEHRTNEDLSEKSLRAGKLLEEVALLLHSNQAEMNASLSMFVKGIDNLLQAFQVKSGEKEDEQKIVHNLEKSLNDLTEKSGNVLHEYVARSREIYSGLLENQLHLTRKIEEITGGRN